MTEMAFYQALLNQAGSAEAKWPLLNTLVTWGQYMMMPIYSWRLLIDELRLFLIQELAVPNDSALAASAARFAACSWTRIPLFC